MQAAKKILKVEKPRATRENKDKLSNGQDEVARWLRRRIKAALKARTKIGAI